MNKRIRTPLIMKVDEINRTIVIPQIEDPSDLSYEKLHRDIDRTQFYSIGYGGEFAPGKLIEGFGGARENGEFTFKYEQQEFNCVLKYFLKFEWKRAESSI